MTGIVFDTLAYANKLKEAGFTDRQAEAQAEALAAVVDSNLATKTDIERLHNATKTDIEMLRRDIELLRNNTKTDIELLRRDMKVEIAEARADIIKWCVGSVFASVGLFAALVKLLG